MSPIRGVVLATTTICCVLLAACGGYTAPDDFNVRSATLSRFWRRPVEIRSQVLLPPSYARSPQRRYPVIYWIPAFDGSYTIGRTAEKTWRTAMAKAHAEYILVFLDAQWNGGHDEFADSANDGPWSTALVREFIPALDRQFRTLPQKSYLAGHSSGAWAVLWLQIRYPALFAGAWAVAPDPVDFHDFTGPDLTRNDNFYRDARGREYGFLRRNGRDETTLRRFIQNVPWAGAQYDSFEAVFSPRGKNGKPEPLFNRRTGRIDTSVARYWESHYDIAALLRAHWPQLRKNLEGKLHVFVGTGDTYHLDGPVRRLASEMNALHADAQIEFIPEADHQSIFRKGDVIDRSVAEMGAMR